MKVADSWVRFEGGAYCVYYYYKGKALQIKAFDTAKEAIAFQKELYFGKH